MIRVLQAEVKGGQRVSAASAREIEIERERSPASIRESSAVPRYLLRFVAADDDVRPGILLGGVPSSSGDLFFPLPADGCNPLTTQENYERWQLVTDTPHGSGEVQVAETIGGESTVNNSVIVF